MADPHSDALIADYNAQLAILAPEIRGLKIMAADPEASPNKVNIVQQQISDRQHRVDLINASISAINTLQLDGYPSLPSVVIPPDLLKEIQQEVADLEAAEKIFDAAASISVDLDNATHVNQPVPKS